MSHAHLRSTAGSMPTVPTSFVTDDGTAIPAANILNVLGGTGIDTFADPNLSNNLYIKLSNSGSATTQTIGATTSDVTIINLGAIPSIGVFVSRVVGFDAGGSNNSVAFVITRAAKTDGATATLLSASSTLKFEDVAFNAADANVIVTGNSVIVRVLGVAGFTINWTIETNFTAS